MPPLTSDNILEALTHLIDPRAISGIRIEGGKISFVLTVPMSEKARAGEWQKACARAVETLPGVTGVNVILTAQSEPPPESTAAKKPAQWILTPLPHVKRIIAVASGKGGVGKSTSAVALAHAFVAQGLRVGLLDADIYGPSLPRMLGLSGQPEIEEGQMIPRVAHCIACMSISFIAGDTAAVLRGPMIAKALNQMLRATRWGTESAPLDVLLVDLPPGTGDIHLSLAQQVPLDGAVIVTTPQEIAVADARKALSMFRKVGVPVLGIIENMSGFADPSGQIHRLFGEGGGRRLAEEAGVELLGEIPLIPTLGAALDRGEGLKENPYAAVAALLLRG